MNYHLIGIGGIGMSGLAKLLVGKGHTVSGSDAQENPEVLNLKSAGYDVKVGQSAQNIPDAVDVVVRTLAIDESNEELAEAKRRGLKIQNLSQATAELFKDAIQIGVAGTHGKTTTTAMVVSIFEEAGLDPSFLIGGNIPGIGNANFGKGPHFIFEADEFGNRFLDFHPTAASIGNIEPDHLDFFDTPGSLNASFQNFTKSITALGVLVVGESVPKEIYSDFKGIVLLVGFNDGNFKISGVNIIEGLAQFDIMIKDKKLATLKLAVPGRHNAYNATLAYVLALSSGIQPDIAERALTKFQGVERRFQIYRDDEKFALIDDYAHHPTEVAATLTAVREKYAGRKLVTIFQPHQYSRTKALLLDFARELAKSDEVILAPILRVRDSDEAVRSVSIEDLSSEISKINPNVIVMQTYVEIADEVKKRSSNGEPVFITMGAAPINEVAKIVTA